MADPKRANPATQKAARDAANRLHHLSMIYGGAIAEIAKGETLGLIPSGYPGLGTARDLADLALMVRAEVSALTALLVKAGVLDAEAVVRQFADEYDWLAQRKAEQFRVTVTDAGLESRAK